AAEASVALSDFKNLTLARLGAVNDNPLFENTPLLAFAMRPGATIDRWVYQYIQRLSVQPSSEGLTRVHLGPEVQAAAKPDLADVRIIDEDGHQWPYLLDRDADSELVAATVSSEN